MKILAAPSVKFIAFVSTTLLAIAVDSGEPPPPPKFSLDAAVRQALVQSPAVRVQEAEIDRREGVREQASGEFDWLASAAASRVKERNPTVDPLGRDAVIAGDTTAYSLSAARKLRNGVIVQPFVEVGVTGHDSPASPTFGSSQVNLQIVVPLLRGLGADSTGAAEAAARAAGT